MFGLGIASGVEHRFMVKEECNLQMGHIVRVGRGTHLYGDDESCTRDGR